MMTLRELMETFPSSDDCKRYLQDRRWPDGVVRCPRCNNDHVYGSKARPFTWQCMKCGPGPRKPYRFSVLVSTIFEDTKYPLKTWFEVLWSMLNAKKWISAKQIQRQIGCGSYETAWYMCMRLRAGMRDPGFRKLMGVVEVDETFIGGKDRNRHWNKKTHVTGGIGSGKVGVIGAISRKRSVLAQIIENTDTETLQDFVKRTVDKRVRLVVTDDAGGYRNLDKEGYKHETVAHSQNEYVRGEAHTGHIESFWSLIKRGIMGSFHHVSKKYLPMYLAEFQFRYNNRHNEDIFGTAIAGC